MNEEKQLFVTDDGSKTYYLPQFNEYYHSHHGAIQEARHVFLKQGFDLFRDRSELSILEVGLGSGLNAFLTAIEAEKAQISVHYTALEAFPLNPEEAKNLDYAQQIEGGNYQKFFDAIHSSEWENDQQLATHFTIRKIKTELQNLQVPDQSIDLIYFDAFGPRVQPELWTLEIFQQLNRLLKPGGTFVTYCAKGQVKRDLKAAGFTVETLPGPPGKREMVRARSMN